MCVCVLYDGGGAVFGGAGTRGGAGDEGGLGGGGEAGECDATCDRHERLGTQAVARARVWEGN